MTASCVRKAALGGALACLAVAGVAGQTQTDLPDVLNRVGQRIEQYYKRVENIICTERVTAQPVDGSMSPDGFSRILEYELRVERTADGNGNGNGDEDPKIVRDLKKVNGRDPKPKDKPGCFDPNPLSPEPLSFLLASHRGEYTFTLVGRGKGKDANALMIDYLPRDKGRPEFVEDPKGRPECFGISLPGATKGRVWVDAATFDVVRIEEHLKSRVDVRVPVKMQAARGLPDVLVVERYDRTIRYKPIEFADPEETVLLPQSINTLALLRGAGSHRSEQVFSNYRRFLTRGRVVK